MPYRCLADFLEDLGHAGQLSRVEEQVDPAASAGALGEKMAIDATRKLPEEG